MDVFRGNIDNIIHSNMNEIISFLSYNNVFISKYPFKKEAHDEDTNKRHFIYQVEKTTFSDVGKVFMPNKISEWLVIRPISKMSWIALWVITKILRRLYVKNVKFCNRSRKDKIPLTNEIRYAQCYLLLESYHLKGIALMWACDPTFLHSIV